MSNQNQMKRFESHFADKFKDADDATEEIDMTCYQSVLNCCGSFLGFGRAWCPFPFCCVDNPYLRVQQSYAALIERFGRYTKTLRPGLHYINPCTETMLQVDLKTQIVDLVRQIVLTKDNLTVQIDASIYFKIINPRRAIYNVQNIVENVRYLSYATLRDVCGQHQLQDLLEKRVEIQEILLKFVDEHVEPWGVKIVAVFIKDMLLNVDLQQSLSTAAKERRLAESKIISAQADVESAKMMRESADILNSTAAMQIRYLETIQFICQSPNTKIVFLPSEDDKNTVDHKITQGLLT